MTGNGRSAVLRARAQITIIIIIIIIMMIIIIIIMMMIIIIGYPIRVP